MNDEAETAKEKPQPNPAQPSNFSFAAGKKSNNLILLVQICTIFRRRKAVVKCILQPKAAESFFSSARLGDETACVQCQNKVGVFHMS